MSTYSDADFLGFISEFSAEHGFPPSMREIREHFGVAVSTVQWRVARLEREGRLARRRGGPRTITVVPEAITQGKQITSPLEQLMARPPSKKRMARFTELTRQMKADPDILAIVDNWCRKCGLSNVGALAARRPKDFDFMCSCIDDLLDQAPIEDRGPMWMQ